jgi:hypothetical protein
MTDLGINIWLNLIAVLSAFAAFSGFVGCIVLVFDRRHKVMRRKTRAWSSNGEKWDELAEKYADRRWRNSRKRGSSNRLFRREIYSAPDFDARVRSIAFLHQ